MTENRDPLDDELRQRLVAMEGRVAGDWPPSLRTAARWQLPIAAIVVVVAVGTFAGLGLSGLLPRPTASPTHVGDASGSSREGLGTVWTVSVVQHAQEHRAYGLRTGSGGTTATPDGILVVGSASPPEPPEDSGFALREAAGWYSVDGSEWLAARSLLDVESPDACASRDRLTGPAQNGELGPVISLDDGRLISIGFVAPVPGMAGGNGLPIPYVSEDGGHCWRTAAAIGLSVTVPDKMQIRDVVRVGSRWVAVGGAYGAAAASVVMTSEDGLHWRAVDASLSDVNGIQGVGDFESIYGAIGYGQLNAVAWNGEIVVTVGTEGAWTSPDGLNWWTVRSRWPDDAAILDLIWTGDRFLGVGEQTTDSATAAVVVSSADGANWEVRPLPGAGESARAVALENGRLVVVGGGDSVTVAWVSDDDGLTWTDAVALPGPSSALPQAIVSFGGGVVAVGVDTLPGHDSGDIIAWRSVPSPAPVSPSPGPASPPPTPSSDPSPAPTPSAVTTPAPFTEPASYTYVLGSRCGERSLIGRYSVTVTGGSVVGVEPLDDPAPYSPAPGEVPTLSGIIDLALQALADGADAVHLLQDPADGQPISLDIDWDSTAIDDELCYTVSAVEISS